MGYSRFFRVTQGKTHVGHVSSRLGDTDIGLATLNNDVEFRNRFIDLPGEPTQLLSSDMLKAGDIYVIDSFSTGRQGGLVCRGKRIVSQEDKEKRVDLVLIGNQKDLPNVGTYMVIVQGIYATSEPMAIGEPIIRAGCCGSAIVKLATPWKKKSTPRKGTSSKRGTPNKKDTSGIGESSTSNKNFSMLNSETVEMGLVHNGEIGGFMHWSDLQEKTTFANIPRLLCYTEVADPLIDAGWTVAKTTEKRKRTNSEDPFID